MGQITNISSGRRPTKVEKARRYLKTGAVTREDSDDELGYEDIPWQWIYDSQADASKGHGAYEAGDLVTGDGEKYPALDMEGATRRRPQTSRTLSNHGRNIIGAKLGTFECRVGDCVLLKADGNNEAWVGIICEFLDDDEEGMIANFMWFSTEKEIRNREKKRSDFMHVSGV